MTQRTVLYPSTEKTPVVETIHGVTLTDNYQWLEDPKDQKVKNWTDKQHELTYSLIDVLPQRTWLTNRFNQLWRYDDESVPREVLKGKRLFYSIKNKDEDKWIYMTKAHADAEPVELLNPNEWPENDSLDLTRPSRDGKYLAFGVAEAGNEDPKIRIMEVATKKILPDTLKGWKQGGVSWLPDNSGFYYSAKPLKGEVPEGEENYWHAAYFHKLGTPAEQDEKLFWHDGLKEYWHGVSLTEDGKYLMYGRGLFNRNDVWFKRFGTDDPLITIVTNLDARFDVTIVNDKIFIKTNLDAPNEKVYVTDVDHPGREHWKEFLPEKDDRLVSLSFIGGKLYAKYLHNAHTIIKVYDINGKHLHDVSLPGIGSSGVSGYWSKPRVWLSFSGYTFKPTTYTYDVNNDTLTVYKVSPIDIDVSDYMSTQVWYTSKDGTRVSMFLLHHKDVKPDGSNPTLLTGYGGFNISLQPGFASSYAVWIESGGMIAMPNLRGGGEYGEDWHKAGMRENKQNVFDDFIAAGEWLIDNKYTTPEKLAISGGSNGGLLVGAVAVQRPDLFKVVKCSVPLLDMVRYHKFGIANIWSEEYGTAEDAEQFEYLLEYSPYHNIRDGEKYPAMLIVGSDNDARVDPMHARKMAARLQEADAGNEPILLIVQGDSGHGGAVTLSERIEQTADGWAFLMDQLGMQPGEN
jgi:prolyl oligopeptidase